MSDPRPAARDLIRRRRADDAAVEDDGCRVLVDRFWPRGVSRDAARIDEWLRGLAPSDGLRRWFGHVPDRWDGFRHRYRDELEGNSDLDLLLDLAAERRLTLVFAARDREHNNAVVLQELNEDRLGLSGGSR